MSANFYSIAIAPLFNLNTLLLHDRNSYYVCYVKYINYLFMPSYLYILCNCNQSDFPFQVCYEGDPESALITFSTPTEANIAYKSTEAVLNNRFIKVFWHNPEVSVTWLTSTNIKVLLKYV